MANLDDLLSIPVPDQQSSQTRLSLDDMLAMPAPNKQAAGNVSQVLSESLTAEEIQSNTVQRFINKQIESGELVQEQPGLLDTIRGEIPQTAGGIAGSAVALRQLAPRLSQLPPLLRVPATLGVGAIGAFGGAGLGKAVQLGYRNSLGESIPFSEIVEQAALAGLEEGAGELVGFGVGKVLGKVGRGLKGLVKLKPGAKEAAELVTKAGTKATVGQLTQNRFLNLMEGFAEKFTFGSRKLRGLKSARQFEAVLKTGDDLQQAFASNLGKNVSPTQAGNIVFDAMKETSEYFGIASRAMYKQVDKELKKQGVKNTAFVDIRALKRFAKSKLSDKAPKVGFGDKTIALLESTKDLPDFMTFSGSANLRSLLFNAQSDATKLGGEEAAKGLSKQLNKMLNGRILASEKTLPKIKPVLDKWKSANAFFKQGKTQFNRKIVKQLGKTLEDNPERLVKLLFKEEGLTGVVRTKQLLSMKQGLGQKTWATVKDGLVQDIFKGAKIESASGVATFSGKKFVEQLDKLGPDVLKATFKPDELNSLRKFGKGAQLLQRKLESLPGGIAIPLAQVGAASKLTKGEVGAAIAVLATPKLASQIATNPVWTEIALGAIKPDKTFGNVARLVRLTQRIAKQERDKQRKKTRSQQEPPRGSLGQRTL